MVLVLTVIVVGAAIDTVVLSATVTAITITFAKKLAAAPAAPAPPTVAATFICVIPAVPLRFAKRCAHLHLPSSRDPVHPQALLHRPGLCLGQNRECLCCIGGDPVFATEAED